MIENQNTYIMNLEAAYIFQQMKQLNKKGKFDKKIKDDYIPENYISSKAKIYSGTLPYSLDLIQLDKVDKQAIYRKDGKQYTDAIINVTFERAVSIKTIKQKGKNEGKEGRKKIYAKEQIRKYLYQEGFKVNGVDYVEYKRSGSKSREGSTLFIKSDLYEQMIEWSHLDYEDKQGDRYMKFGADEEIDLPSLRAYESLTLSGLKDGMATVKIQTNQILLIDDVKSAFTSRASITSLKKDKADKITDVFDLLDVKTIEEYSNSNDIWDGQSLLDTSKFIEYDKDRNEIEGQKGFMLLRNSFFKSAGFNTNIQQYFQDHNITEVTDLFGKVMKADKIKLIITPNSLKFLKMADRFADDKINKIKDKNKRELKLLEKCYKYWLKHSSNEFGICKSESESPFNEYQKMSYQMLNSMKLSQSDIRDLIKDEILYIELLKNDPLVFKKYVSINDDSKSRNLIYSLLSINNPNIIATDLFKQFQSDVVESYIDSLKMGGIKVDKSDYMVLVGNPYEMLRVAGGESVEEVLKNALHKGSQIYCSYFRDNEELAGFRNPLICSGNVWRCKNVWKNEFKYFNFTENIAITNGIDNDMMDRNSGSDFDSDSALLSNNPILIKRAEECQSYATPINGVSLSKSTRTYTKEEMASVDNIIANNLIGEIVNLSQVLNSYYWDLQSKGKDQGTLDRIYDLVSILSSCSQLEIDKAKKYFDKNTIDMKKVLDLIRAEGFIERGSNLIKLYELEKKLKSAGLSDKDQDSIIKLLNKNKMVKPSFFKFCAKYNISDKSKKEMDKFFEVIKDETNREDIKETVYKILTYRRDFETSMDYLVQELKDNIPKKNYVSTVKMENVLVAKSNKKANTRQIKYMLDEIEGLQKNIKEIYNKDKETADQSAKMEKRDQKLNLEDEIVKNFEALKITQETLYKIITIAYSDEKIAADSKVDWDKTKRRIRSCRRRFLKILWATKKDEMLELFKGSEEERRDCLKLVTDYRELSGKEFVDIWGEKYIKKSRKNKIS